jgi:hypothetical protein
MTGKKPFQRWGAFAAAPPLIPNPGRRHAGVLLFRSCAVLLALVFTTVGEAAADDEQVIPCKLSTAKDPIKLKTQIGIPLDDTGIADQRMVNPRRAFPVLQLPSGDDYETNKEFTAVIWKDCGIYARDVRLVLINRTARNFGVQFNLVVPDARAEVETAYKNLLARVLRVKPPSDASSAPAYEALLEDLKRPSSVPGSCQWAIARLDLAPSQAQVNDLRTSCIDNLKASLESSKLFKLDEPRDLLEELSSAVDRLERSLKPTASLPGECKYDAGGRALRCSVKVIVPPGARIPGPQGIMTYAPQNGLLTFTVSFADTADIPSNSTGYLKTGKEAAEPSDSTQWRYSAQLGAAWDPDTGKSAEMRTFSPEQPYAGETLQHFVGAGNLKLSQKLGYRASATATLGFKNGDLGEKDTTRRVTVPEYALNLYGESGVQLVFGKYTLAAPSSGIAVDVVGEGFELRRGTFSIGHLIQRESTTGEAERSNRDNRLFIAQVKNRPFFKADPKGQPFFRTWTLVGLYGSEGAARLTVPNPASNPMPDDPACENPSPAAGSTPATRQLCYGYRYWTGGFELSYAHQAPATSELRPKAGPAKPCGATEGSPPCLYPWSLSGTLSAYYSGRDLNGSAAAHVGDRVKEGRGESGLANANYVHFRMTEDPQPGLEQEYLVGLQVGYGSGTGRGRKVDHGYLGENTSFAPDQIFLSRIAGHLADRAPSDGGPEPVSVVAAGLGNKLYEGLAFAFNHPNPHAQPRLASPLWQLARLLGLGETDPVSQLTTLRCHHYSFNEPVFGRREAGVELDLELSMEVPKGITTTIDLGKFFAGSALRPVIAKDPWQATASIKVDL